MMRWRRRKSREQDLERELRDHLDLEAEERQDEGLTPDQAAYAARRAFGNTTYVQEEVRQMWTWTFWERLAQDLRYALRTLRNTPGFTAVAVLSLALGIGANTAIFSLLNAVVLRLLPVSEPQRLVQLTYTFSSNPDNWNSFFGYPHLERFQQQSKTMSGIFGGVQLNRVTVVSQGISDLAQCDAYTDNFFSVLGLAPQHGRLFTAGDDHDGADVVVLSDRYWRTRFNGDPTIIGQTILIDQLPFTVIGVAPPGFSGIYIGAARDLWVPLHTIDRFTPDPKRWQAPFTSWLRIVGRLRPGVSMTQAEAELDVIHRRLDAEQLAAADHPSATVARIARESRLLLRPAANGTASGLRDLYSLPLKLLMGVAGMVLLISCANVANLVLARASRRRREIAVRMALGSGRMRVIRQLLTENLLVAGAGGVLALAAASWGGAALVRMISTGDSPVPIDVRPDWSVFAFTAAVSLASGILFGLAPALRSTRLDPGSALKEGGRGVAGSSRNLDRVLVTLQVTLSLVLIAAAGLFTRTVANLRNVDVGFDRDNILMFSADAKLSGYTKDRAAQLYQAILEKIAALPGVQTASVSIVRPIDDQYYLVDRIAEVDGRRLPDAETIKVAWNSLSPGYFSTVGTPLVMGRDFDRRDGNVVILNETLARQALPGLNPIGHRLANAEVIGVAKDSLYADPHGKTRPVLYRPLFHSAGADIGSWLGAGAVSFEIRYRSAAAPVNEARQAVAAVDRSVPIFYVKTLRAQTEDSYLRERLLATISSFFGGLAVLLACLGLYGLMAYAVACRTAEIGIRTALGASRREITWLVLRESLWLMAAGSAAGVPIAVWLSRFTKSLLFGIAPADPGVLAVSVVVMIAIAAVAGFLPARRAARIDPMVALRYE